eukprot:366413-Chlamydomonas_euryale.AAC.20
MQHHMRDLRRQQHGRQRRQPASSQALKRPACACWCAGHKAQSWHDGGVGRGAEEEAAMLRSAERRGCSCWRGSRAPTTTEMRVGKGQPRFHTKARGSWGRDSYVPGPRPVL